MLIKETKKVLLMPHQVTEIEAISEEMLSMNKESVLNQIMLDFVSVVHGGLCELIIAFVRIFCYRW